MARYRSRLIETCTRIALIAVGVPASAAILAGPACAADVRPTPVRAEWPQWRGPARRRVGRDGTGARVAAAATAGLASAGAWRRIFEHFPGRRPHLHNGRSRPKPVRDCLARQMAQSYGPRRSAPRGKAEATPGHAALRPSTARISTRSGRMATWPVSTRRPARFAGRRAWLGISVAR